MPRTQQGAEVLVAGSCCHEDLLELASLSNRLRCRPRVEHDAERAWGYPAPGRSAVSPDLEAKRLVAFGHELTTVTEGAELTVWVWSRAKGSRWGCRSRPGRGG
jgi:hypothetical protein